ncbi:TPA_asm: DUF1627 domain-containing protein [Salmonella enterica subsp. enterica serovar Ank]|uniref:DUF1627 domain-containing protein n=1 Tax=Salmonella enterica subsp. enterica serovar Ank TaxID=1173578 RepID=A0A726YFG8_SALET|nr:DUF1627 domain-containing protein [Salmonella enterica subsp. enterica serovar Ank]
MKIMVNETVLDALKAMGKASYREVAARLKIEPVEALNMLREQREQGLCDFYDGCWELTGDADRKASIRPAPAKSVLRAKNLKDVPAKPLRGEVTEPIKPEAIVALLTANGRMDTVALASAVGRDPRGLASNLCMMAKRGYIQKIGQGKGVKWELPAENQTPASEANEQAQPIADTQDQILPEHADEARNSPSTAELVSDIPSFTESYPGDLIIPSPSDIARMIRKAKRELRELEQVRLLSVAAKKCRKTLNRIHADASERR